MKISEMPSQELLNTFSPEHHVYRRYLKKNQIFVCTGEYRESPPGPGTWYWDTDENRPMYNALPKQGPSWILKIVDVPSKEWLDRYQVDLGTYGPNVSDNKTMHFLDEQCTPQVYTTLSKQLWTVIPRTKIRKTVAEIEKLLALPPNSLEIVS